MHSSCRISLDLSEAPAQVSLPGGGHTAGRVMEDDVGGCIARNAGMTETAWLGRQGLQ